MKFNIAHHAYREEQIAVYHCLIKLNVGYCDDININVKISFFRYTSKSCLLSSTLERSDRVYQIEDFRRYFMVNRATN